LLFKFQPIGLAFGVAIYSSFYLLVNYFIVKELFNKKIALISTIFLSFSSVLIDFSRFSWNPNLLPLFVLLTIYFAIKSLQTNKWHYFFLLGAFLSFSIQLHYLALFLIPAIGIIFLSSLYKKSVKQLISQFHNFLISVLSFIIFSSPLIIFDLRHNFLNSKLFLALFKSSGTSFTSKINSFFDSFYYLNFYSFNINLNKFFIYVLLVFLFIILFTLIKKSSNLKTFLLIFFITIVGMSLYNGPKHPHYFGILFPLYFVIISYFLASLNQSSFGKIMIVFFISGYIFLNFQKYYFLRNQPNNQIAHAEKVAQFLDKKIGKEKFNFAVQPDGDPEDAYLYFLELKGKVPLDRKKLEVGNEMFIVCGNDCDLKNTKSWNINMFGKFEISSEWSVEGVRIYKLIR